MSGPVTGIVRGPRFKVLPKRNCEISFSIEAEDGSEKWQFLQFEEVGAHKCTYLPALKAIPTSLCTEAYGKIVKLDNSSWLSEVSASYDKYYKSMPKKPKALMHLVIFFDDGPFYEIICGNFQFADQSSGKAHE